MGNRPHTAAMNRACRLQAARKRRGALGGALAFLLWLAAPQEGQAADAKPVPLELEVTIGGAPTNAIVAFSSCRIPG